MVWNNPTTFVGGLPTTAATMNAQVRDNMKAIGDSWTAYSPTWAATSGAAPAIGNGTLAGAYKLTGKHLHVWIRLLFGTTTTFGTGAYTLTLPAGLTPVTGRWKIDGLARDESATAYYELVGAWSPPTSIIALLTPATTAGNNMRAVSATSPFTLANTDEIFLSGSVELA